MTKPKDNNSDASASSGDHTPTDDSIRRAITDLAKELDMQETTYKKLNRLLARRLGVSADDLQPRKSFIKKCMNEVVKKQMQEEKLPTEFEIEAAARELSSQLNMEATSFKKFNRLLCHDLHVEDLTPAKAIIRKVFKEASKEPTPPPSKSQLSRETDQDTAVNTASMTQGSAMESTRQDQSNNVPVEVTKSPRKSTDLEHGEYIPEAAGLTWKDDFFDDHDMVEDLVAVFDHVGATRCENAGACSMIDPNIDIFAYSSLFLFSHDNNEGL
jgi:hypothetical protein